MRVLELFSGTRSIGRAFEARGHEVYSVDYCESFEADSHEDIAVLGVTDVMEAFGAPDVVWASPDCTTYSVAALGRHRKKDPATGWLMPVTDYAKVCDAVNQHLMRLIEALAPQLWFIENPRGGLRKMPWMRDLPLHGDVLPIRLPVHEADGHMDKRPRPALQAAVQARRPVPRGGAEGREDRHAGHLLQGGPGAHPARALRPRRGRVRARGARDEAFRLRGGRAWARR